MVKCKICGKEFENSQSLGGHIGGFHSKNKIISALILDRVDIIKKCEKCGKEFIVTRNIRNGMQLTPKNEKRFCSRSCANGHKHTDECNKKISNTLKMKSSWYKDGRSSIRKHCKSCGSPLSKTNGSGLCRACVNKSKEYREKLSKGTKGKCGGLKHGSGRGKKGWYKGFFCDSSWELAYVIYNLEHEIKFTRNTEKFEYIWKDETHYYIPDFILEDGSYVEIKGYRTTQVEEKTRQFKKQLEVIDKHKIKAYIDYVECKYGKDFIRLYEKRKVGRVWFNAAHLKCVVS